MSTKVTIECDARFEDGLRRALAMFEDMEQLALTGPNGQVFDLCEQAVIEKECSCGSDGGYAAGALMDVVLGHGRLITPEYMVAPEASSST